MEGEERRAQLVGGLIKLKRGEIYNVSTAIKGAIGSEKKHGEKKTQNKTTKTN